MTQELLHFPPRMGQLCPDYINRTATPALFAPLMTQTSYATVSNFSFSC